MNKRNRILQAAVAAALIAPFGLAHAGTITAGNINYASEAVAAATALTLGNVVYTLGVARTTTQPFTILYTLTGASNPVFNATPAVPTAAGGTCAIAGSSLKRGGVNANNVVFDVVVSADCAAGDTLTLVTPVIKSATATTGITVQLLDTGETACVDNAGTPATCIVPSTPRSTIVNAADFGAVATAAPPADTGTIIDVNATVPLAGFVVQTTVPANDKDTATTAKAVVGVHNTLAGVRNAANTTDFTLAAGDLVTLALTDVTGFLGLAAGKLCYDVNTTAVGDGTTGLCTTGEVFTVSGNTATLAAIPGTSLAFASGVAQTLSYQSDAVTAMGTSRTIGITGAVTPTASGGPAHAFTGNASFWQWSSNGTVLQAPLFQTTPGFISRFVLTNTGTLAASFTAVVRTEPGNTCTLGPAATGQSIPANSIVVFPGETICTAFTPGSPRGAAIFTINAPSTNIQGVFQIVNLATGAVSNYVMVRPGTN